MPIEDIIKPEMLYYGEIGIVQNRDSVDVDVDAIIKRLQDKYEFDIGDCFYREPPQFKNAMINYTRSEPFWYKLFDAVSKSVMDSQHNWLGDYEYIRDRLVIENLERMINTINDVYTLKEDYSDCENDNVKEPIFPIKALYVNK